MVELNTLLCDRYRLEGRIATGGMGTVFRAIDEKLDREVAVKLLAANLAEDEKFVERFRREARAAAGLRHPNIANVFDAGEEDDSHFIVMELAHGKDLARLLREEGPLSVDRALPIVMQICRALGHAHAAGIIHRDVKPANVIIGDKDVVKVTDFGIARAADDSKLTMTGSVLGTAHYISPEQANGTELSPRSDIYSLGIVTYEVLTGALPFTGDSLMGVAMRHVTDDVPAPSLINHDVPPLVDSVVQRATQKDPAERFADTSEMEQALAAALDEPTAADLAPTTPLGATTELATEHTVWPIPGDRWDPVSLGRKVLVVFGVLAAIALVLVLWRLAAADAPQRKEARAAGGATAPDDGDQVNFTIPSEVIGMDSTTAQALFDEAGYTTTVEPLEGKELVAYLATEGIDVDQAESGEVVGTDPPVGSTVQQDQTITLFVSGGNFEDDKHEPKGKAKGHGKEEKDD